MASSPGFRGVLLDLFGTLVPASNREARLPHLFAMAKAVGADPARFEHDWSDSDARFTGSLGSLEETIRRLAARQAVDAASPAVDRAAAIRLEFSRRALEAAEPVLPALDALREAGLRLALVSDTSDETPRLWPQVPLSRRFDAAVFSCEVGFCKPDPRMYQRALEGLGLRASDCAYVGDGGSHELTGATAVGLRSYFYRFPGQPATPEYRFHPETDWNGPVLRDLRELLQ